MEYDLVYFEESLEKSNIKLSRQQIDQFILFYEMLIEKNKYMNLTSITEYKDVIIKHFIDSIYLINYFDINNLSVIDVGTGAGFPGIPLKIAFPSIKITLIDSLNKRVNFLNEVIKELKLDDIKVVHGRAEDLARKVEFRENYDISVSRAVANLSVLLEYNVPFLKNGGHFISYKGDLSLDEINQSKMALSLLNSNIEQIYSFKLPNSEYKRNLIQISKNSNISKIYPRKAGLPEKSPL